GQVEVRVVPAGGQLVLRGREHHDEPHAREGHRRREQGEVDVMERRRRVAPDRSAAEGTGHQSDPPTTATGRVATPATPSKLRRATGAAADAPNPDSSMTTDMA